MASVSKHEGAYRVQIVLDRKRLAIRLPGIDQRTAEAFARHIDALNSARLAGAAPRADTAAWLGSLPDSTHAKLVKIGLAEPRVPIEPPKEWTLGELLARFFEERKDAKASTRLVWGNARRNLEAFFGADKVLSEITAADADSFRIHLARMSEKRGRKGKAKRLGENTIRKRISIAKQFFRLAVRSKWISENPFADQKGLAIGGQHDRAEVLSPEEYRRVLAACPDREWRLIIALSRYGGLRCPSEHLALTWDCVDWEKRLLTVRSPKTEHHSGRGERLVPIFDELLAPLDECFHAAPEGARAIITRYRDAGVNLRSQFQKILRRAGVTEWPRLFHAMRATRQTELARVLPIDHVCRILGNSPLIASRHYLSMSADDYEQARLALTQILTQQVQEPAGIDAHFDALGRPGNAKNPGKTEVFARSGMDDTGLEPVTSTMSTWRSNQLS
jgi:integrase